jgi:integrase
MARKKKEPRRKPNTGSIRYKAGRALPWEAAFPIGHGEHRYESFVSRPEAAAFLDKLTAERDNVTQPRNIMGGSMLVKPFFAAWIAGRVNLAPNTITIYHHMLGLASGEGELGRYRLDQVTRDIAQEMLVYFGRKQFKNVAQIRDVCRQAFEYALDERYITSNPFTKAEAPHVEARKAIALTEPQRASMLRCAAVEDIPWVPLQPIWHLYSRLGFRRGEAAGLRWIDCDLRDLDRATITIQQQLTRQGTTTSVRDTTKGHEARAVPCPRDIAELLLDLKAWQISRCAQNPDMPLPSYVFTDAKGDPLKVDYIRSRWLRLRDRAGLPDTVRLHDLRHTAMYLLALNGVPEMVRMALAGHKSSDMASRYANHATLDDVRRALA